MNREEGLPFLMAMPNLRDFLRNHFFITFDNRDEETIVENFLDKNLSGNCFWIRNVHYGDPIDIFFEEVSDAMVFKLKFLGTKDNGDL
jgi:hypothetical protein